MSESKPNKSGSGSKRKRTILPADSVLDLSPKYKGMGRPTKLNADVLAKLETACRMACSIDVMAPLVGVDPDTIVRWRANDPRLKLQMEIWKAQGLHMVNRKLWEKATNGDRWAIEFILRFRHPDFIRNNLPATSGGNFSGTGDIGSVDFSYI
jgi:hypothetical protein